MDALKAWLEGKVSALIVMALTAGIVLLNTKLKLGLTDAQIHGIADSGGLLAVGFLHHGAMAKHTDAVSAATPKAP